MTTSFYAKLLQRKKSWTPTCGQRAPVAPGSEDTLGRALALRILEIPVGDWIAGVSRQELALLTPDAVTLLASNVEDEYKHDQALNLAHDTYQLTTPTMQADARTLTARWLSHPDHPIVKAAVLETSVFFVILPMMRFLGGPGLRTISGDISNDESIHVATNRQLAKELGYTWSPSLDRLREETVQWLVSDLDAPGNWGYPEVWIKSSRSLLEQGIAPDLEQTKSYVMPAFFEHRNDDLPMYA